MPAGRIKDHWGEQRLFETRSLIAGVLMSETGTWSLVAWFAGTHGALAAYAWYRYNVRRREPLRERKFQLMLRTTPAALRLLRAVRGTRNA